MKLIVPISFDMHKLFVFSMLFFPFELCWVILNDGHNVTYMIQVKLRQTCVCSEFRH